MSADNGIYIIKSPDGYRIAHAQAIGNIDYHPNGSVEWKRTLKDYFGKSKIYDKELDAIKAAVNMSAEIYTEYGVKYLGEYESFL